MRLGGTHEISNLIALNSVDHAEAHLMLYKTFGDVKDLCASYMIKGLTLEARKVFSSIGGKVSQANKKLRGDLNGFQAFSHEKRKTVASNAGKVGGSKQYLLGIGIHTSDTKIRSRWAKLGAEAVKDQFTASAIQSSRGKRGGVKNKGFKWCNDGIKSYKYTKTQQMLESFEDYLARTGMINGRTESPNKGGKFYNDSKSQWVFRKSKHPGLTFEQFVEINQYNIGKLKNENFKNHNMQT